MEIISNSGVKMAIYKKNRENLGYFLTKFTRYSLIGLLSVVLVSESVGARATLVQLQIAQQTVPTPSVPLSAEKQKRYQEGVKLYKEGQELEKKGTKEGYLQAIEKYQQVLKMVQELGLRKEEVDLLASIANVYNSFSDNKNAIQYFQKALDISRELKQPISEAVLLGSIGVMHMNSNNPKEGLTYLEKAKSIFLAHKEYHSLATTLKSIAGIHIRVGDTKQVLYYYNEALKIYRETLKDPAGEANTLQSIAMTYSLSGETKTALHYYEQALKIQRQRKDVPAEIEILQDIAVIRGRLGNTTKAVESLKEVLKLQEQVGSDLSKKANTLAQIGHIYAKQADYRTAIDYFQQAGKLWQQVGDTQLVSMSFQMIANAHTTYSGDYQTALKFLDKALELQFDNKDNQAFTLGLKADVYASQGNYQQALEEYNKALKLQRSIPNPKSEVGTLLKIAQLYRYLGDYQSSINICNKALEIFKRTPSKLQEIQTLVFLASVHQFQDKYDEALASYKQALSLVDKENYQSEIQILQGMSQTYRFLNNYPKALESANRALKLSQENSFGEEHSVTVLAGVYRGKGEYKKSLDISEKVLADYRKTGLRVREAQMLGDMSITYAQQKNYQKAIDLLNEELKIRRELKESKPEASVLYSIAINQRKLDKPETALTNINEAIKIVESIRSNVKNPDLRTSYFATVQSYYKFKIDLLMELNKKQPSKGYDALALNTSEASRARGLVDLLTEAGANIRKGANPQLLAEEQRLQQLLNGKEKARIDILSTSKGNDVAKSTADKLGDEIADIISQQQQLKTQILTKSPEYAALKYPQPLELKGIQQQLDKHTILLQYSLGKERSYLWLVTPDSVQAYELPKGEVIEKAVANFRYVMDKFDKSGAIYKPQEHPDDINQPASQLSQMVLAPVANKLGKKRLVIVADGALQNIPFAALADPGTPPPTPPRLQGGEKSKPLSASERGSYQPLLVNHEIVNLPSITAIATQRKQLNKRPLSPKILAVLADPLFPPQNPPELNLNDSAQQRAMKNLKRSGLDPLPGTRVEAEAMLKLLPSGQSTHAFGADANYEFATNPALKQYQHLFFATHGLVDTKQPELSGIALAQVDKDGKPVEKGYLRLGDIFNMDWAAELVVLSACETGLGKDTKGEGLVGLTRGLMYAGSKRAVVSLWNVSDKGTSELMPIFYKEVLAGKSPSVALREAQLQMWQGKEWKNPFYWAAFTLQGEWR
ncbi:CHAT domain-containing tetratricopeptide repeat protein [Calothrix sp. PCC 6303]|uniref:CHAT domain-containing tetratricopeptide repeat protein n=1 Tax=Calothrix sp. PCC 6303 TaxID=1170562 RepID=UPI0002A05937|nr:CHAT domain-containing protein [Calothrix sp. PCC 6303]AFZ01842.1 Tetratricopeptide TPR_2 repeat-containing protein [Calothrix sp. PCC 6303]